ncbi:putative phage-related endonuclease [Sphingomonas kaistensis]|uniref:Putative phage-related endonuclease n=1 Tax=Sphingomonas kaistensis TaxID=298708 RepID=A0A7X6BHW7_9SPHN|nr:lambda exonuclease family protein [Sphingomonas kaistensis]NJC06546.1 putative phage-related endonuclease [Sphingomonas kaistensis]
MTAHIRYWPEMVQGSDEWHQARCGLLTASELDRIITPSLKIASNAKERAHCWELAAQRITNYVEPTYISDAMLRGHNDEYRARELYSEKFAPVTECGFVTNARWGFTLGCSPDGLVGDEGMIECKSRGQKFQVQTLVDWHERRVIPEDFVLQVQGQLLITGRKWCDLVSYSGGLPMITMRVEPAPTIQDAILEAAAKFEARIHEVVAIYQDALASGLPLFPTERTVETEMFV